MRLPGMPQQRMHLAGAATALQFRPSCNSELDDIYLPEPLTKRHCLAICCVEGIPAGILRFVWASRLSCRGRLALPSARTVPSARPWNCSDRQPLADPAATSIPDTRQDVVLLWASTRKDKHHGPRQAGKRPCHKAGGAAGGRKGKHTTRWMPRRVCLAHSADMQLL
jgi:hypothetical protein